MTVEQRQNRTANARAARKLAQTEEALERAAKTAQARLYHMSPDADRLCNLLSDFNPIPELAVGRYNIDIGIPALQVAIELDGGSWHDSGRMRARDSKKEAFLRARGWLTMRVASSADADYLRTWLNRVCVAPGHIGKERMITGGAR